MRSNSGHLITIRSLGDMVFGVLKVNDICTVVESDTDNV